MKLQIVVQEHNHPVRKDEDTESPAGAKQSAKHDQIVTYSHYIVMWPLPHNCHII